MIDGELAAAFSPELLGLLAAIGIEGEAVCAGCANAGDP